MASIIDEFIVAIGIDSSNFDQGERRVREQTRRAREDVDKSAQGIELSGKRMSSVIRSTRNEVAGLFLAFAGASTIKGFIGDMLSGAAAAGRMSDSLGVSIERLHGVRNAVRAVGGTDAEADSALSTLTGAFQNYQLTGTTGHDADFQGLGVSLTDLRDPSVVMQRLAEASERMTKPEFVARLQRIGLPPSVINSLAQGSGKYRELVREGERLANVHEADAKAAQEFQEELNRLTTTIRGLVQPYLTDLVKVLGLFAGETGELNALLPIAVGLVAALGVAASAAYWPWILLAGAIAGAVRALQVWNSLTDAQKASLRGEAEALRNQFGEQIANGDFGGAAGTIWQGMRRGWQVYGQGDTASVPGGAGGNVSDLYNVLAKRYGKERADGIWAGIGAESAWNPNAVNPDSGAFGLGQWLGPRKRALFARYGRNPTAAQQLEFLMWELEGGDHGGAAVLRQNNRVDALSAYVHSFMRPGPGAAGDMRRGMAILGRPINSPRGASATNTSTTTIGTVVINSPDPNRAGQNFIDTMSKKGVVVQANSGMSQ